MVWTLFFDYVWDDYFFKSNLWYRKKLKAQMLSILRSFEADNGKQKLRNKKTDKLGLSSAKLSTFFDKF